jgi:hypothetical protein
MSSIQHTVDTIVEHINKFPNLLPSTNVRLEEFNFDGVQWVITLSFVVGSNTGARTYKTFVVDDDSGRIKSMRISPPKG